MFGSPLKSHEYSEKYHNDRLIVKVSPAAMAAGMRALAAGPFAAGPAASSAMSLLERMDRGGMIRRVTDLDANDSVDSVRPRAAVAGLMSPRPRASTTRPATGLRMIQATKGTDLTQLQAALMEDANIDMVSQVPIRYLLAKKKVQRPAVGVKLSDSKQRSSSRARSKSGGRAGVAAIPPAPVTMWNLQKIKWQEAQASGFNEASGIRVSVLDTGVDLQHPDLPGDEIDYTFDYGDVGASERDIIGHGSHVSGTIRALVNGDAGINGICNCQLAAYKIFDDEADSSGMERGWETFEYFVDPEMYHSALLRCTTDGTRVINLSIGGFGQPSEAEKLIFEELINSNVCVVAAMGNESTSRKSYPAAIPGVIAVGASRINDKPASFSNRGNHIWLIAPGEDIWSTLPTYPGDFGYRKNPATGQIVTNPREQNYDAWPGTSMATPHVVAAIALMLGKNGSLNVADVRQLLRDSCDKVAGMNNRDFTTSHGYGRLNLLNLANLM